MVSDSRKKQLISSISKLDKEDIDINTTINKKIKELNKMEEECNRKNTTDSRKKSLINKKAILEKDLINLNAKLEKNSGVRSKANAELNR